MNTYALVIGAAIAVFAVLLFKAKGLENTKWAYPIFLGTFPIYYWVFAVYASDYAALLEELMAGVAFLAIGYIAYKFRSFATLLLLAIGYVMHAAYDFYHNLFFVNTGAPTWWPELWIGGCSDWRLCGVLGILAFQKGACRLTTGSRRLRRWRAAMPDRGR